MTSQFLDYNEPQPLSLSLSAKQKSLFLKSFWAVSALSFYTIVTAEADLFSIVGALIIAVAALYPSYLWCCDRAKGFPLFPLLAINFLFTYSFPLVSKHNTVQDYSSTEHFISSLIVASFLGVATFTWISYVQKNPFKTIRDLRVKEFGATQVFPFFITALILRIIYQVSFSAGYLWLIFPGSVISLLRAITGSTSFLAIVTLSYLLGEKLLKKRKAFLFL
nr:hypothetical protein [Xenococcaceae cyanobacterium MO_207.B15]